MMWHHVEKPPTVYCHEHLNTQSKGHIWCHSNKFFLDPTFCTRIQLSIRKKSIRGSGTNFYTNTRLSGPESKARERRAVILNFSWLEKLILHHLLCYWCCYCYCFLYTHMFNPQHRCNTSLPVLRAVKRHSRKCSKWLTEVETGVTGGLMRRRVH